MTGPIDGNFRNFGIRQGRFEKLNEAALAENKPILSFARSNPIQNISNIEMPAKKQQLDLSGLPPLENPGMIARYVTPEQQARIGANINQLLEYV